jgi:glutamate racemase
MSSTLSHPTATNLQKPIGVFDSGIGGLTVLKGLIDLLPHESWIYLGDTARLPYGSKSPDTIRNYTLQNLKFLKQYDCKAFVIACNSASTQFPDKEFQGIPVFNVIEPGVQAALSFGKNKKIGIIGTKATINSAVYKTKLQQAHYVGEILSQACPLFVPLVEEGLLNEKITDLVIEKYLHDFKTNHIESLILGCTHYPLLKEAILKYFNYPINLISSEVFMSQMIKEHNLEAKPQTQKVPKVKIMTTDDYKNVEPLANKILQDISKTFETIDFKF